ncbi:MAG TPA: hypothetical protein VD813_16105 [Pseudonocardia sp.]|nr:hypothetical protein [Pseudonocardia sp.]
MTVGESLRDDDADRVGALLAAGHAALVDDLAAALDLAAGAAEATQPAHLARLVTDLGGVLDLDAGLAAAVGSGPRPAEPEPRSPAFASGRSPDPEQAPPRPWTAWLDDWWSTLDHGARLKLRTDARFRALRAGLDLAVRLDDIRSGALDLARSLDVDRHGDPARGLLFGRGRARALARAEASERGRANALALVRGLERAVDLCEALVRRLDPAPDNRPGGLVAALVLDLDRARDRARVLVDGLGGVPSTRDLDLARGVARDLGDDLRRALDGAVDLTRACARGFGLDASAPADAYDLRCARDVLHRIADDFTDADLGAVSLTGVRLDGIRWSSATRWPIGWEDRIRAASVEVGPGVFEVTDGRGRTAGDVAYSTT